CILFRIISIYFISLILLSLFFFFNDTSTTEIYTLSLHDALPILNENNLSRRTFLGTAALGAIGSAAFFTPGVFAQQLTQTPPARSEEHTSELQSRGHLVCRLLLEKKNKKKKNFYIKYN